MYDLITLNSMYLTNFYNFADLDLKAWKLLNNFFTEVQFDIYVKSLNNPNIRNHVYLRQILK